MPTPQQMLRKKDRPIGATVLSDLGEDRLDNPPVPAPVPLAQPVMALLPAAAPTPEPQAQGQAQEIQGTDQAAVKALLAASLKNNPRLALAVRSRGPIPKERQNLILDSQGQRFWRKLLVDNGKSGSEFFSEVVLPWVKANAEPNALRLANVELSQHRKVSRRQLKAAIQNDESLDSGYAPEVIYYPLAIFNSVKALWAASGLKKKPFLEACIVLYLMIHVPEYGRRT